MQWKGREDVSCKPDVVDLSDMSLALLFLTNSSCSHHKGLLQRLL